MSRHNSSVPDASRDSPAAASALISIVVPAYNEANGIIEFNRRLSQVRAQLGLASEVIFVDDGSRDETRDLLYRLHNTDPTISVIGLSRNFGKEIAMTAGLDHSCGQAVVIIDADLQDPPELIPTLVARWREEEADVVYAQRQSRAGESWTKKATAYGFYRVANRLARQPLPIDTGDFRLLSRRAVDALSLLREQHRFMKGLFSWIGYRQIGVPYERHPRFAGKSKWNFWRLWNFSLEGITSFSIAPLRISSYIGFFTAVTAIVYGIYISIRTMLYGNPIAGYPSLVVIMLFLGGVQLLSLGIIGEYLGRVFNETKRRPLYLVDSVLAAPMRQMTGSPDARGTEPGAVVGGSGAAPRTDENASLLV